VPKVKNNIIDQNQET